MRAIDRQRRLFDPTIQDWTPLPPNPYWHPNSYGRPRPADGRENEPSPGMVALEAAVLRVRQDIARRPAFGAAGSTLASAPPFFGPVWSRFFASFPAAPADTSSVLNPTSRREASATERATAGAVACAPSSPSPAGWKTGGTAAVPAQQRLDGVSRAAYWHLERLALWALAQQSPDWTHARLATHLGHSRSWVSKWLARRPRAASSAA